MTNDPRVSREEYLSFLQSLYGTQGTHSDLTAIRAELTEISRRVMDAQVAPDAQTEELLNHILKSMEVQSHSQGTFLTSDAYVRREAGKILAAFGEENRRQIEDDVTFGSLPLPDLNGMCIRVPEGGYLVLINIGTLAFCEVAANLLAGLLTYRDSQGEHQPAFSVERAAGYLIELTAAFPAISPLSLRRYAEFRTILGSSNPTRTSFSCALGDSLTNFVIAHEISHFVRGHVKGGLLRAVPIGASSSTDTEVDAVHFQHSQEFEADLLGAATLVLGAENTGSQADALAAMIATQVYFFFLELMEQVQHVESASHPPATERRQHLLRELDYREDVMNVVSRFEKSVFQEARARVELRKKAVDLAETANTLSVGNRVREAADQLGEASTLANACGDHNLEVATRTGHANLLMQLADYHEAIREYQSVAKLAGDLKELKDGDDILVQTARAYSELGEPDAAVEKLKEAIVISGCKINIQLCASVHDLTFSTAAAERSSSLTKLSS